VVLPLRVLHARTLDAEDCHPLAVHTPDLHVTQLAAADEAEGPKVQILGLKHRRLPLPHACGLFEESSAMVGSVEVRSVSPLLSGRRRGVCQDSHPTSVRSFRSPALLCPKTGCPKSLSRGSRLLFRPFSISHKTCMSLCLDAPIVKGFL